ncbi:MAG: methylaspartate mutase subunit E, partial [Chloroflexi bacterium]|nr:methylaspartate mutase subunit E [Chloroflexota bacterium]
ALRALEVICLEYARRYGYDDVFVPTVSDQWMGAFPYDESRANAVIAMGAVIPHFGGATQVVTKSAQEAGGIPTKEANAAGAGLTKTILTMLEGVARGTSPELALEQRMIEAEARAIVDRTIALGDGDVAVGVVRAFRAGVLDVPWSPNLENQNLVMPVRDGRGAVRYLYAGNVPLPPEVRAYNDTMLAERGRAEGREPVLDWALADVSAVARGLLIGTGRRWEDAWRAPRP